LDVMVATEATIPFRSGSVLRLSAPSMESKIGTTFGGATVKSNGTWRASSEDKIRSSDGKVSLLLPAASAAILIMNP